MINIQIENCNSIDSGEISIRRNALNVKYGINGAGKSTIAKAIQYKVNSPEQLINLKPFKHGDSKEQAVLPAINGLDDIKSIMIFDEDFINNFTFKKDEIIQNSFEIFIKDSDFELQSDKINVFVKSIKEEFEQNEELKTVTSDLSKLSETFGKKPTKSGISKSSKFFKSLSDGNKLINIPDDVLQYASFIKSDSNTQWITWQAKGNDFLDIDECCPFCASEITHKKEEVKKIASTYEPKLFEHLVAILDTVEVLGSYFSEQSRQQIVSIVQNKTGISKEEELTLKQVKEQIDLLLDKLSDLNALNHMSFTDNVKVIDKITELEINLDLIPHLKSDKTLGVTSGVNQALKEIKQEVINLQKSVGEQRSYTNKLMNRYKNEINQFLEKAGYRYQVFFDSKNANYPMKLKHKDLEMGIPEGRQHLSYGEKNAFAMLLFMYQCLSTKPDLIVLDDPISSFDKNKKYAIMRKLFVESNSLKNSTVLMLTHDFDPIIDFFKIIPLDDKNKAHHIYSKQGNLKELLIENSDVLTFIEVCDRNIKRDVSQIIKLIYLRRKLDATNDKASAYDLISNIAHRRNEPLYKDLSPMSDKDVQDGIDRISSEVKDFDYQECINIVTSDKLMIELYEAATNDYEKLQIFRILTDGVKLDNNYLQKYINEVFHIENDNISQLDPNKYHLVPEFIAEECNNYIESLKTH
ncbi:AAA family ATPase [Shewanella sp. M16]|uniref:AAA family ATPase n=1 Tax=Shewanella sp. M16 TaxID=2830837 RepID=UPI001BB09939|nr:AAA family ATPase [Shewanella sp. M16]MBS0044988.1 AAA family ATPase [Shewanella sp. M16]